MEVIGRMRKKTTTMLAAFALAATATVGLVVAGPAPAANAADVGVNMNQACQIQHGIGWQAKLLDAGNAYSWRCRSRGQASPVCKSTGEAP